MRIVLAVLLVLGFDLQARAQSTDRRPFTETDYQTYFSEGSASVESPTYDSKAAEEYFWRGKTLVLSFVETMPRWDRASPYTFLKIKGEHPVRTGVYDKTRNARIYERTDPALNNDEGNRVWLSNDNRTTISTGDVPVGAVRDYYKTLSRAAGRDPEADDVAYRHAVTGRFAFKCEFVKGPTYDVECVDTSLTTGQFNIRRFRRQAGTS